MKCLKEKCISNSRPQLSLLDFRVISSNFIGPGQVNEISSHEWIQ